MLMAGACSSRPHIFRSLLSTGSYGPPYLSWQVKTKQLLTVPNFTHTPAQENAASIAPIDGVRWLVARGWFAYATRLRTETGTACATAVLAGTRAPMRDELFVSRGKRGPFLLPTVLSYKINNSTLVTRGFIYFGERK